MTDKYKNIIKLIFFPFVCGYNKYAFSDKWISLFFNPFFFARINLHRHICSHCDKLYGRILDVGCGKKPYKKMISHTEYIGLEIDTPENRKEKKADFFYDGKLFPFKDREFDSILTTQVLEHVFTPEIFVSELNRVLKPGGRLLLTVPFIWDEHEQPFDYGRYSSFGLKALLEKNNFTIIQQSKSCADITVHFQLFNAYLFKKIGSFNIITMQFAIMTSVVINVLGILSKMIFPGNDALYLDNVVLAEKNEDREMNYE